MTRAAATAVVAIALALAGGAFALATASDHLERPVLRGALYAGMILGFALAGVVAARRRPANRTGWLMVAVGLAFALAALSAFDDAFLFTVGNAFTSVPYAIVAVIALGYPTGAIRGRVDRALVWVAVLLTTVGQVGFLLVADADALCSKPAVCPENLLDATDRAAPTDAVTWTVNVAVLIGGLLLVARLAQRWRRGSPALRRVLTPVYATTSVALAVVVWRRVVSDLAGVLPTIAFVAQIGSLLAVPASLLLGLLRSRLARGSLAGLMIAFEDGLPLRAAVAEALGDPTAEIAYRLEGAERWVDGAGSRVAAPAARPGRAVTLVGPDAAPVAALVHDAALGDDRELLEAVAAAFALALRSERLQAELRAQYRMLERTTDTAPSVLVHLDTQGRIVDVNRAAILCAGVDDEGGLRGRLFWDVFIEPGERDAVRERFAAAAPRHPPAEHENAFVDAQGRHRVIAWRSAPVEDDEGRVEGIIAGGIDITDRVQRELELARERDATTTVLETIPSVVAVLDREGRIRDRDIDNPRAGVNRAFREALGWDDLDLVGTSFLDLVAEPDRERAAVALRTAAAGKASDELESELRRSDGGLVAFAWTATPVVDVTGRTSRLVLVSGVDVTQRRRQQHELRASRARIVSAGDEARRRLERNLHDGAQQRLVALSVTLRLAEERIAAGRDDVAPLLAGAREELAHALDELRELARGIHPAILTDRGLAPALEALAARAPLPVEIDPPDRPLPQDVEAAIYYVVAEALTNVTRYAQATRVWVDVVETPELAAVFVRDDGVGGADPAAGSGLRGLADRVGALDGRLVVDSPQGGGTVVHAEIPLPPREDGRS